MGRLESGPALGSSAALGSRTGRRAASCVCACGSTREHHQTTNGSLRRLAHEGLEGSGAGLDGVDLMRLGRDARAQDALLALEHLELSRSGRQAAAAAAPAAAAALSVAANPELEAAQMELPVDVLRLPQQHVQVEVDLRHLRLPRLRRLAEHVGRVALELLSTREREHRRAPRERGATPGWVRGWGDARCTRVRTVLIRML